MNLDLNIDIEYDLPLFTIDFVSEDRAAEAAALMARVMAEIYPRFSPDQIREKVGTIGRVYLRPAESGLLAVFNRTGRIVAMSGVKRWDDRIVSMRGRWPVEETAELDRVYVQSEWRRRGLGERLVEATESFCWERGYRSICLHTHRFLNGAWNFWKQRGYRTVAEMEDDWQTIFMDKRLAAID